MKGLLDPAATQTNMPAMSRWLQHASRAVAIAAEGARHLEGDERLLATIQTNVIVQIENLRTHPLIQESLERGELKLHGWVYKFETGQVFCYEPESAQFVPLSSRKEPHPVYPRGLTFAGAKASVRAPVRREA